MRSSMSAPVIEWFRTQLSLARAHLDDAIGAADQGATLASMAAALEICRAVTAELYKTQLAPGERGEIERELSALRSGLQSLQTHRPAQK